MREMSASAWLNQHTKEYRFLIVVLTVIEILINLLGVGYAIVMKQMVDQAVAKNSRGFWIGITGFALLAAGQLILRIITRQLSESVRSSMENGLKENLFSALFYKEYEKVGSVHSEEWMNRITSDTAVCAGGMTDIMPGAFGMFIRLCGSLAMIFYLEPKLALIIIPGGMVFLMITAILRNPLKHFHKQVQEKDGKVRVYIQERISSMLVIRTFGMEDNAVAGASHSMKEHKKARMQKAMFSNVCNSGYSLAINGMYLIGIAFCGHGIIAGNISFGTLTAIIQLIGQLQSPLSGLSGYIPGYYAMMASAERLMEVEKYPEEDMANVLSSDIVKQQYEENVEKIVFDNVSFSYDGNSDILNKVSFSINKGDYAAITGTSGCGKSTMLKVLMGIYKPDGGKAFALMKDGGERLMSDMRRLFAYVPQGNFLMSGTIRDVISFGENVIDEACKDEGADKKDVTIRADRADKADKAVRVDRMKRAIHLACADFVYELPDKLDTMLGEKGSGLSEGQMQRIAIARALYAECPVLILDEATSALDRQTECQLLKHLKELTDKTVLVVTHRPKALEICNRKIVFTEKGVLEIERKEMDEWDYM